MANVKHWPVRLWRWQVTVRPIPVLVLYGCLYAVTWWLPYGAINVVSTVLWVVITILAALVLAILASAWRQRRKAR